MSCISMSDLGMICRHFNLNTAEVFELLSSPTRAMMVERSAAAPRSATAVSDSASEASSVAPAQQYKFASSKTADFAKDMCSKHDISMDSITATGNGGKITKEDVKKALPAKKRGRKRKGSKGKDGDMVDKLKTKDPNAPKRPGNAWLLFLNANRASMVSKHPGAKMPEITKLVSVDYKALSAEDRKVWTDQYDAAKVKYAAAMTAYKASKEDSASVASVASADSNASKASSNASKASSTASKASSKASKASKKAKVKIPKEHKAAVREELKKLAPGNWTSEQKLAALKSVVAAKALAKEAEKRGKKADKIQSKVDEAVTEILSYVQLNKLNADDEKSLRNRVKDVDEHCQGSLIDGVTLKEMKSILKEQKAVHRKLAKAAEKAAAPKKAVAQKKEIVVEPAVVFDDDLSDSDSDSDDELDEEPFEFEWNGSNYWRSPQGHVMEEEDGAVVGRWDDEEQVIQFDD